MDSGEKPEANRLSPLDWLMPRYYMPQIYCLPLDNPHIRQSLQSGLHGLVADVPFLLSAVVGQEHPVGSVALTDPYRSVSDIFSYQDLSGKLDYEVLRKDQFPLPTFNENDIIVPNTLKRPLPTPAPVFWARLTLVRGGAFLYMGLHHSVADMTGFGSLVKLWASHCRTGSSAAVGFDQSWLDRSSLCIPPSSATATDESVPFPDGLFYEDSSLPAAPSPVTGPAGNAPEYTTAIFHFPTKALEQLKGVANSQISALGDVGTRWVSTNDVLTAVLWSAVVWAEHDASTTVGYDQTSRMAFPVNIRSRWNPPLPDDYLGAACGRASAVASTEELLSLAYAPATGEAGTEDCDNALGPAKARLLAKISAAVRAAVTSVNEEKMRAAIAFTASQPDISRITRRPIQALMITSWADHGVCDLDWGTSVGRCEAVRFATFPTRVRPIVLPRLSAKDDGGLEVLLSLDQAEMRRFGESALVKKFGSLRTSVFLGKR